MQVGASGCGVKNPTPTKLEAELTAAVTKRRLAARLHRRRFRRAKGQAEAGRPRAATVSEQRRRPGPAHLGTDCPP